MVFRIYLLLLIVLSTGCATSQRQLARPAVPPQTVIVFLVDGMPVDLLVSEIRQQRLPNIERYFLRSQGKIYRAHTSFPSLTFPAIASLITERPVSEHGIFGNTTVVDGRRHNFERPRELKFLNQQVAGKTIFSRLRQKGLRSASFAYSFYQDANIQFSGTDLAAGLSIVEKNYAYLDDQLIGDLSKLLNEKTPSNWPDFIFVHLVGLDFTAHDSGPSSEKTRKYLQSLDTRLKSVFDQLRSVELKGERHVVAMMTSDHGFDPSHTSYMDIENAIEEVDDRIRVLNEGRYVGLYFSKSWAESQREDFLREILKNNSVDIVARRAGTQVYAQRYGGKTSFPPFFFKNISFYFQAPESPDAVIIAKPGVSFKNEEGGHHGGPTEDEIFVPLLLRNAKINSARQVPALWELLNFL